MKLLESFLEALDGAALAAGNMYQLSLKCGISATVMTRWKKEKRSPSLTTIEPLLPFLKGWPCAGGTVSPSIAEAQIAELKAENERLNIENQQLQGKVQVLKEMLKDEMKKGKIKEDNIKPKEAV